MISIRNVSKRFGTTDALRGISFEVGQGEVVGFVGPNGAGKSTALRILTGYIDADVGRVEIDGLDVSRERAPAVSRVGYMPEAAPAYPDMRVSEYLRFRARLKGVPRAEIAGAVDDALGRAGLADQSRRFVGQLSKGYRQRVGVADALVANPPVLILDEPTAGLDPVQVRGVRTLIRSLAKSHTILISSHVLPEIEAVSDRVVVLVEGRVVADAAPSALRAELGLDDDASLEDVFVTLAGKGGE